MSWNILRQNQQLLGLIIAGSLTVLTSTAAVWGQNESDKVTASDGAANDEFGRRVSIDGDTAIIGARQHDHDGADSGSAYIFERDTLYPSLWNEVIELRASDAFTGDHFGRSVAISGNVAVVGAIWDDHSGLTDAGSAYIFRFSSGSWSQEAKLIASDAASNDQFGVAVAIDGNVVLIAANRDDHSGLTDPGSAYIFRYSGGSWSEEDKITASDATSGAQFGFSVSVLGDIALIGAPFTGTAPPVTGTAYVFKHAAANWTETHKLTASDADEGDHFGWAVALETDLAVVGAAFGGVTELNSGSAYVFRFNDPDWDEEAELAASESVVAFGTSVSISGATIICGAKLDGHSGLTLAGSAWVYHYNGSNWVEEARLTASDAASSDKFGIVALSGGIAFVGAFLDDDNGTDSGSAYVFDPVCPCPWDLDGDGAVAIDDLIDLLNAWGTDPGGPPDFDDNGDVDVVDLDDLVDNWGLCPCVSGTEPPSLADELAAHCLTTTDWDDFRDKMENGTEEDKDRYLCWMIHYLFHCNNCTCEHLPECPSPDPYN